MVRIPKALLSRQQRPRMEDDCTKGGAQMTFLLSILSPSGVAMKDSQLLVGIERCTMQVECIFMIPDIFVHSPCDYTILGASLLSS